jgi:hypothetical protein
MLPYLDFYMREVDASYVTSTVEPAVFRSRVLSRDLTMYIDDGENRRTSKVRAPHRRHYDSMSMRGG